MSLILVSLRKSLNTKLNLKPLRLHVVLKLKQPRNLALTLMIRKIMMRRMNRRVSVFLANCLALLCSLASQSRYNIQQYKQLNSVLQCSISEELNSKNCSKYVA